MQLKKMTIGRKAINFSIVLNPDSGDDTAAEEKRNISAREEPLPELTEAFSKLPRVVCEIMAFPKDYASGMSVDQVTVSYTQNGTRAVQLRAKKSLDTIGGDLHAIESPFFKIDPPADGESGSVQASASAVKAVKAALLESERYANGERSQKILNFDETSKALNAQAKEPALI